ncbi:uncharacterized protein SOCEGT47_065950 [Sorangium cellulosum]|uniref:Protein kinase domain-containing protein n=1 Tax=Sorangium cellulosum TaxID=56 RepID=A0A4V0NEG0_SORCE|nr:serine/threonine-protein kinase [Sorangium cellulosum]AUX26042.1 uncharacterized protein SOCEGT47_065950 [Sorangium cellulosum]
MDDAKEPIRSGEPPDITAALPATALSAAALSAAALAVTDEIPSALPSSNVGPGKERDSAVGNTGDPIDRQVFQPGQSFHQVEIVRFIGAGYSGQVYEVRHRMSGARCALKIMHLRDRQDARKVERSLAEAHGTFGIEHANVVDVFDIGCEADGTAWMLMEFLDGPTLATILERQGRLSPRFALHVALEVAWGLDAAHENQIIHRDVKPDNIAFTAEGEVKVVDFSIAKVIPYEMRTTQRNVRLGTCAYMAPENLDGADADARFDIYSLGLVLWEMLAGRHPFQDAFHDRTLVLKRQFVTDPEPLSTVAGLPEYVDEVIRRATAKDPAARYLTMAEMAQALIALRNRLEKDEAEGRISFDVPPGEPPIPGRSRPGAVYRPPVTGPTLEVPRKEPSAKVVVASPVPDVGPGGTLPIDRESVRAAAFGPGPGSRDADGGAPISPARTARGTEIMPVAERASPSRPPPGSSLLPAGGSLLPAGGSRPPAARTTGPMLRHLSPERASALGDPAGEERHRNGGVRVTPWVLIAMVLASSVLSALAVRWIAPPGAPQDGAVAAGEEVRAPGALQAGTATAGEAVAPPVPAEAAAESADASAPEAAAEEAAVAGKVAAPPGRAAVTAARPAGGALSGAAVRGPVTERPEGPAVSPRPAGAPPSAPRAETAAGRRRPAAPAAPKRQEVGPGPVGGPPLF